MQVASVLVVILGIVMLSAGLGLTGAVLPGPLGGIGSRAVSRTAQISSDGSEQRITTRLASGQYAPITVTAGVPVVWTIEAAANSINGCNETFVVPAYGIRKTLVAGKNVVRFTPKEAGQVPYSCWMGMIRSAITVKEPETSLL
jgi:plastocyanin domain-containing protein